MLYGRSIHAACYLFSMILQLAPFITTFWGGHVNPAHPPQPRYTYALYCISYAFSIVGELYSEKKDIISLTFSMLFGALYLTYCWVYVLRQDVKTEAKVIGIIGVLGLLVCSVLPQYDKRLLARSADPIAESLEIVACILPCCSLIWAHNITIPSSEVHLRGFNMIVDLLWIIWAWTNHSLYWVVKFVELVTDFIMILMACMQSHAALATDEVALVDNINVDVPIEMLEDTAPVAPPAAHSDVGSSAPSDAASAAPSDLGSVAPPATRPPVDPSVGRNMAVSSLIVPPAPTAVASLATSTLDSAGRRQNIPIPPPLPRYQK